MQTIGNICVALAAVIYAFPLQYLLWELSRKKDDGGGAIAGVILLAPLWLLLLVALLCTTAHGGFDWLKLSRTLLYGLVVAATLSLAAVTLTGLATRPNASLLDRLISGVPIRLLPALTMAVVVFALNPRFAGGLAQAVRISWTALAALCLLGCAGYLGYKLVFAGGSNLGALAQRFRYSGEVARENLARIPALDPEKDFQVLLGLADQFQSREVREAATARLRTQPKFLEALIAELNSGAEDKALAFIESASLTPAEQQQLAAPACAAMKRYAEDMESQVQYMSSERRKSARKWGTYLFESVAKKLGNHGVDFQPAIGAYEAAFASSR